MKEIIKGSGGGGKGGGGSTHVAREAPDTLHSNQYARVIDLICEGEIEGLVDGLKSVYLDNTPIQNADGTYNFKNVSIDVRTGTPSQFYIPGFSAVESETAVGVKPTYTTPVVRTISDSNIDIVRVTLGIPRLTSQNKKTGDLNGYSVHYSIEVQYNGGGYVEVVNSSFNGKTTTRYQRSHDIPLTGDFPVDIRVNRLSADNTDSAKYNDFWWDSYTKIIDEKFSYPNSALIGLQIDASQFNHIPTRGYECKLLKVQIPSNYDPITRTYTGAWDGVFKVAWTDNPAWCFYDLVVNDRYGLGRFVDSSLLDKWNLYEIAQYCDELVPDGFGGMEPRFTCNLYLQTREEALNVLRNFASIFRSMIYWSTSGIALVQDKPDNIYAQFTNADVIEGVFNYQGSSSAVRHTVALVTWNDPNDAYKQKIEYVEDHDAIVKYGFNETEIVAFGCTSRGQAHRIGKWLLYTENNETEIITFSTALKGTQIAPGVLIETMDSYRAGVRYGGRLAHSTPTELTLDSGIDIEAGKSYNISVTMPDGAIETRSITNSIGTGQTVIHIDYPLSDTPLAHAIWVVSASDLNPEKWRVISVSEEEDNIYTITAIEHNSSKYSFIENNLALETLPSTIISSIQDPVTVINVEESLYTITEDTFGTKIHVSWERPAGAVKFSLMYRKDSDNYITVNEIRDTNLEIVNAGFGTYDFKIIAYNALGTASPEFSYSQVILGETAPPEDVTNFSLGIELGLAVFRWDAVSDLDVKYYEIREGMDWATGTLVTQTKWLNHSETSITTGSHTYMIKAKDYYGNYSNLESTASITIVPPAISTHNVSYNKSEVTLTWASITGTFPVAEYEIREGGTSWADAIPVASLEGNSYTDTITWSSNTYRIKARDTANNYSAIHDIDIYIANPTMDTFTQEYSGESIILHWTATKGSIDIESYEIRYGGTTWANATTLTTTNSMSITIPVTWKSRIFWIRAKDYRGNESNTLSQISNITSPSMVTMSHLFASTALHISWTADANTLPIKEYEVRKGGTDWATSTFVARTTGTTYSETIDANTWADTTYWVKAIDSAGNEASTEAGTAVSITKPSTPVLSYSFDESTILLSWTSTVGTLPILEYEVRYDGTDWASANILGRYSIDSLSAIVEWGTRTYRIKAIDIAGFTSNEGSTTITITPPSISSYTIQVVDNNALLYWSGVNGTLPYQQAELRRGATYSTAQVIGRKTGTFTVVFEQTGGDKTYWLAPIDTAGNVGTPISKTVSINQPPDYILRADQDSNFTSGTLTNAVISTKGALIAPVNTTETWQQHFTAHSWDQPSDQTAAGYPIYIQPTLTTGSYIEVFDFGTILPSTKVTATLTSTVISGSVTVTPTISISTDDITYTDYQGVWEVLATNFRYVKVKLEFTQTGDTGILEATNLNLRLDVKLKNDSGSGTASTSGATINFNVNFIDVDSIVVTPLSSTALIPVVDFVDTPNPTSFTVYLFDTNGNPASGNFSWAARGY